MEGQHRRRNPGKRGFGQVNYSILRIRTVTQADEVNGGLGKMPLVTLNQVYKGAVVDVGQECTTSDAANVVGLFVHWHTNRCKKIWIVVSFYDVIT